MTTLVINPKQYTGLVTFFAKKYERPGTLMDREELIQEGWLVFARCQKRYADKPLGEFDKILKTSLNNHMMSISMYHTGRNAQMVDMDTEFENIGFDEFEALYVNQVISHMVEMLDDVSRLILLEMLDPSPEVLEIARIDQLRKKKLKSQGVDVRGHDTCRVLDKHIAQHLGIPKAKMSFFRDVIRVAAIRQGLVA